MLTIGECRMKFKGISRQAQAFLTHRKRWHYLGAVLLLVLYGSWVWAAGPTLADFAKTVTGTFQKLRGVMTAAAYIAGVGFAIIGLLKFKAHKDNPAQIPLS